MGIDLHRSATHFLLVDVIDSKKRLKFDGGPRNFLINEILRCLGSTLPSLADVRNRPQLTETANRGALIDEAKAKYEETCDTYVQQGIADTFRVCAVAYFKDVLFFDGNSSTTDHKGSTTELVDENKSLIPLHEVIRIASAENEGDDGENKNLPEGGLKVATTHQIVSVATWLADRSARDGWEMMPTWKRDKEGANGKTYADFYHLRMQAMSTWCREFWTNPNFNVVNLCDQRGANRLVSHLVRLDRLPKSNPLEGSVATACGLDRV